jgi:type IV secretory pathway TrbL component
MENWQNLASTINNAFFFVADKIISIQSYFIKQAWAIGEIVLFIALASAGLNYALTGQGLKENMIKIMKAFIFFFIITTAYPRIIGWITNYAYTLASESIGNDVEKYYDRKLVTMEKDIIQYSGQETATVWGDGNSSLGGFGGTTYTVAPYLQRTKYTRNTYNTVVTLTSNSFMDTPELKALFSNIKEKRSVKVNDSTLTYTSFAPAAVVQLLLITADNAFKYADGAKKNRFGMPDPSTVAKGLISGFFLIFTGIFALIEYLVCFLEFMLVASVGVMFLPLSIWEGSKFLSEKYIGAIVGFFMKLLFCNIAIFLLLYGYVSMFHIIGSQKFGGSIDQIAFIIFTCLLFFVICKSAPGIAQSLLTGTPSLSAAGAIGAVTGAVGAAVATARLAKKAGSAVANTAGSVVGGGAKAVGGAVGSITEANAARNSAVQEVANAGGDAQQQKRAGAKAFFSSIVSDVGDSAKAGALGLAHSISGGKNSGSSGGSGGSNPHSWKDDFNNTPGIDGGKQTIKEHLDKRKDEGRQRGRVSAGRFISNNNL